MPTALRFNDGQKPVEVDEEYEEVVRKLGGGASGAVEFHSQGTPMMVFPASLVIVVPKQ